jgi:predicted phosphoribosyltransferase
MKRFCDRAEAGRALADMLGHYANRPEVLVLALPRGGVPVAFEIAKSLRVPLDVFVVRKLGVPGHEELAMGAIASGEVRVTNPAVIEALGISDETLDAVTARERWELERRERAYRQDRAAPTVRDRIVIVVDDGIATGSTMLAAIAALSQLGAQRTVVATPTIARDALELLRRRVDEVVAVLAPETFRGVGEWYLDFSQTSDEEVRDLLQQAAYFNA